MKAFGYFKRVALGLAASALAVSALGGQALALDKVSFGTNWLAEAEQDR